MKVEGISEKLANQYKMLISELCPDWDINIFYEDVNLYNLGFVDDKPCTFVIDAQYEDILALHDRILDLEVDVYSNEEILYKDYEAMIDYEKEEYKIIKKMEKEYIRYSKIYGLLNDILEQC